MSQGFDQLICMSQSYLTASGAYNVGLNTVIELWSLSQRTHLSAGVLDP